MKKRIVVLLRFILIVCSMSEGLMGLRTVAQDGKIRVADVRDPHGRIEQSRVAGYSKPFKLTSRDIRVSVLAHPVPALWLEFPSQEATQSQRSPRVRRNAQKVQLATQAKEAILTCWRDELAFYYQNEMELVPNAQAQIKFDMALSQSIARMTRELEKSSVLGPNGRRTLSRDEASEIARFLGLSAARVVKEAKAYKRVPGQNVSRWNGGRFPLP